MSKELIIDKDTNLDNIDNRDVYTKLVIMKKINPKKLSGFKNIKEIILDGSNMNGNIHEKYLNLYTLASKIERIKFSHITEIGKYVPSIRLDVDYYKLNYPNLKSIEFSSGIKTIYSKFLNNINNLEEIIFNIGYDYKEYEDLIVNSSKLKRIIINVKYPKEQYVINLDYQITNIFKIVHYTPSDKLNKIQIEYENDEIKTIVNIDVNTNEINYENTLRHLNITNGVLYIPDCITNINGDNFSNLKELNMNLKLLDKNCTLISAYKNKDFEKIILRNDNNMRLFPERIINVNEYGELVSIQIKDNLLKINYYDYLIEINKEGKIKEYNFKRDNFSKQKFLKNEIDLNKLTERELKEYFSYKVLLELIKDNDLEYKKAMEVIEDRVIKRLIKK